MSRARLIRTDSPVPSQSLKPEAVPAVKRYETLLEVALGADVAEHVQLLLVFSAHAFFLSVRTVETREFSGSTRVLGRRERHGPRDPPSMKSCWTGTQIRSSLRCLTSTHPITTQLMCVLISVHVVAGRGARGR